MSEDKNNQPKKKYIVPPSLISRFYSMIAHYKTADGEPVMIVGDTGVGKTMFVSVYESLYKFEKGNECPIVKANCAHFGGRNSDPNIARTELFGLNAASINPTFRRTDQRDVVGLVERANGGLLILEEIGELPLEVQSMLLTFVETGEYQRVGDTDPEPRKSIVRIVGALNREKVLRDDFRYRFFPFYVPPICERRVDILYYLANRFEWLIVSLSPLEIFALLAHKWPGGVREVECVGRLLKRKRELVTKDMTRIMLNIPADVDLPESELTDPERLLHIENKDTSLNALKVVELYNKMKESGVNVDALEKILNHFNVGLNVNSKRRPFRNFKGFAVTHATPSWIDASITMPALQESFQEALRGYYLFCSIFFQKPEVNKTNFNVTTPSSIEFRFSLKNLPDGLKKSCQQMMNEVFEFLSGIKLPKGTDIPEEYAAREAFFINLINKYPDNKFLSALSKIIPYEVVQESTHTVDIFSMKEPEFIKYYIDGLENRWGSIPKAAEVLGIPAQTLYGRRSKSRLAS